MSSILLLIWRLGVRLVMSLPRNTFYALLLPCKLEKLQKLFNKEHENVYNLKLSWAGESIFWATLIRQMLL